MSMTKKQAIAIFGNGAELGRAIGLSRSRISQWPEDLGQREADLVVGAALRLGKQLPPEIRALPSTQKGEVPA